MIVSKEYLKEVASEKYTFISTGMSNMEQIKIAVDIFKIWIVHSNNAYSINIPNAWLRCEFVYPYAGKEFKCNVGYSGHETGQGISYRQ